jgi:LemA protein
MKKMLVGCIVLVVVLVVLGVIVLSWGIGIRNGLIAQDENVKEKWSQVQNVYQRRIDLVPNLVETVKGYAAHEIETFTRVTDARARVGSIQVTPELMNDPQKLAQFQRAQGELSSALSRLLVVAENYPNLKANENFLQLQSQLEGTENRITVERMRYNEAVKIYNVAVRRFPDSIVASYSGLPVRATFEAEAGADRAPKVSFK